jgi:integrase
MPRKGSRTTLARGIYKDSGGIEIRVMSGGVPFVERYPLGTSLPELQRHRKALKGKAQTAAPRAILGTLEKDIPRYLKLVRHLASARMIAVNLAAWPALYPRMKRHEMTAAHVLKARHVWQADKKSPKTINHRVNALRRLYRLLDGKSARTPCDDIDPLPVPRTVIQRVTPETILAVDARLQAMELDPKIPLWNAKSRARFRVLASCGRRPSEVMRAEPQDVDLEHRVWVVRDGKGGFSPGLFLNADMLAAWALFIAAEAWGPFSMSGLGDTLRSAGWPKGVRPYQLRHNAWIHASEAGIDLADIAAGAGHAAGSSMTRKVYVPVLNSRMQQMSEAMDGRFGGWESGKSVVPVSGPNGKPQSDR